MKNTIRILSIVAVVMSVLSLLSCGVVILFQRPLLELFNYSSDVPFSVPISTILDYLRIFFFASFVCLVVHIRKLGIWAEIVLLALNILPLHAFITTMLSYAETIFKTRLGYMAMAGNSMVKALCAWPNLFFGYAYPLCLLVCGMSIAYKVLHKSNSRNKTAA